VGTGKTMLVDYLLSVIDTERYLTSKVVTTQMEPEDLVRMVASGFGLDPAGHQKSTVIRQLEALFVAARRRNVSPLIIVDEVHSLPRTSLEELRMISNYRGADAPLVQIILLGQTQFRDALANGALEQVKQRVVASSHLRALSASETRGYIEHRLRAVGWAENPTIVTPTRQHGFRPADADRLCGRAPQPRLRSARDRHEGAAPRRAIRGTGARSGGEPRMTGQANGASYHRPGASPDRFETAAPIVNALSVDVEDYYQVGAFARRIARGDWDGYPSRVEANTEVLLDLFDGARVRATFFVLGWIAERHPDLVSAIAARGHEVASHGYSHTDVRSQSPAAFRADVRRTRALLEDISGTAVRGYRAANFSIGRDSDWAFAVLEEEGYAYSSSVYPMWHDQKVIQLRRRGPFTPEPAAELLEIPLTTVPLLGLDLPCSGGGYFRLLPYGVSRWALRRVNRRERRPFIFYLHPWEIDPKQPRITGLPLKSRLRHYVNLARVKERLRRLLEEFRWDRVDKVFLADAAGWTATWPRRQSA
jgi:polysaccharide deacetylase family protein (PEP-CTERM system associated)